jgi:hypothetical protein
MKSYETDVPDFIDCTTMARLMGTSRTRLYQLMADEVILRPVYLIANRRPVYTKEMAVRNLKVKQKNVGVNGRVIMFYSSRPKYSASLKPKAEPKKNRREEECVSSQKGRHDDLIEALEALGIENIKPEQIDSAIRICFPDGTNDVSEDEILRAVFRHCKCQNPEHNQRT